MQIEQAFGLPGAPADTWPAFKDIALLVECLPGAALTGPAVDGELPLRFDVRLGPIAAGFIGSGRVAFDDATRSGRFEGSAADRRTSSRVKGAAAFRLEPQGADGTAVQITVDYTLSGSLAQFSRGGIVRELASALTAQFASNLASRLQSAPSTAAASSGAPIDPRVAVEPSSDGRAEAAPHVDDDDARARKATAPSAPIEPLSAPARRAPAALVPLSAGTLLMHVLKARWRRLLDRLLGRRA